jgi:hypothetical protein
MFKFLVDTCVWLDLAKDSQQQSLLPVLEELIRQSEVSLILPRTVVDEFIRNKICPANLRYGTLTHDVADALHYIPGPFSTGNPHWWRKLAYGSDGTPQTEDGHYEWIMRPELVQALQEMRWHKKNA